LQPVSHLGSSHIISSHYKTNYTFYLSHILISLALPDTWWIHVTGRMLTAT
jgi:hypothetical protein